LLSADVFGFNPLPSATFRKDNDEAPSLAKDAQLRQRKLDVMNMHDGLNTDIKRLQLECERSDDEPAQVSFSNQICLKSIFSVKWP
jgi:hypothetical protein